MAQHRIPAVFMRGGTSKAVMFHARDLPAERDAWAPIFRSAIGANDPSGRQLDGMGGGVSSLSKVCVIGPPSRADADVDYHLRADRRHRRHRRLRRQLREHVVGDRAVRDRRGPRARAGRRPRRRAHPQYQHVEDHRRPLRRRARRSRGRRRDGARRRRRHRRADPARIHGARRCPHRQAAADRPRRRHARHSRASAASRRASSTPPIPASSSTRATLDCTGIEMPDAIERNTALQARLEAIRRAASVAMGHRARPRRRRPHHERAQGGDGRRRRAPCRRSPASRSARPTMDIVVRMISVGQAHRAVPLTGALCLAVATRLAGTIPATLAKGLRRRRGRDPHRAIRPGSRASMPR